MYHQSCTAAIKLEGYKVREDGLKHCEYCGSLDPEELADLIKEGKATMSGSDWKYGWPHKFYVDIQNPTPDKQVAIGFSTTENGQKEIKFGPEGHLLHAKFYSLHLALVDGQTFDRIAPIISEACGITWFRDEKGIAYKAPYPGYQKP